MIGVRRIALDVTNYVDPGNKIPYNFSSMLTKSCEQNINGLTEVK